MSGDVSLVVAGVLMFLLKWGKYPRQKLSPRFSVLPVHFLCALDARLEVPLRAPLSSPVGGLISFELNRDPDQLRPAAGIPKGMQISPGM